MLQVEKLDQSLRHQEGSLGGILGMKWVQANAASRKTQSLTEASKGSLGGILGMKSVMHSHASRKGRRLSGNRASA